MRGYYRGICGILREHGVQPVEFVVVGLVHHLHEQVCIAAALYEHIAARAAARPVGRFEHHVEPALGHGVGIVGILAEIGAVNFGRVAVYIVIARHICRRYARFGKGQKGLLRTLPLFGAVPVFHKVAHMNGCAQAHILAVFRHPAGGGFGNFGRELNGVLRVGQERESIVARVFKPVGIIVAERADVFGGVEQPAVLRELAFGYAYLLYVAAQQLGEQIVALGRIAPPVRGVAYYRADAELAAVGLLFGGIHAVHAAARVVAERFARVGICPERVAFGVAGDGYVVPRAAVIHRKPPQRAVELAVGGVLRHVLYLLAVGDVHLHGAVMALVVPLSAAELGAAALAGEYVHPRVGGVVVFGHHKHYLDCVAVLEFLRIDGRAVDGAEICVSEVVENVVFPLLAGKVVELFEVVLFKALELHAARRRVARHRGALEREEVRGLCAVCRHYEFKVVAVAARVLHLQGIVAERAGRGRAVKLPVGVHHGRLRSPFCLFCRHCVSGQGGKRRAAEHGRGRKRCKGRFQILSFLLHSKSVSFSFSVLQPFKYSTVV